MGGNIFDNTSSIKKENIIPTIKAFLQDLKKTFPKADLSSIKTLGSVGKKPVSGDIDLALSGDSIQNLSDWGLDEKEVNLKFEKFKKRSRTASDESLMKRAVIISIGEILEEQGLIGIDLKKSGSGALFLSYPQYGPDNEPTGENVQIDVNIGNVDWLRFAYHSDKFKDDKIKGLHRTQLMLAMFAAKGYVFSHNYGVKHKATNKIVANTPDEAINLLNKLYNTNLSKEVLRNYYKLNDTLKAEASKSDLKAIYSTYIRILDRTPKAHIPEDLEQFWIDNQENLKLTGKFLPDDSPLKKYAI